MSESKRKTLRDGNSVSSALNIFPRRGVCVRKEMNLLNFVDLVITENICE